MKTALISLRIVLATVLIAAAALIVGQSAKAVRNDESTAPTATPLPRLTPPPVRSGSPTPTPIVIGPRGIEITVPTGPTATPYAGSRDTTKGTLVSDRPPVEVKPIVVSGLPREFHSGQVIQGKLLCPKYGPGGVLQLGCVVTASDELKKHSFSPATALGSAAGKDCASYSRVAGLGPAFADTHVGGQCWACPAMMERNITAPIDGTAACTAGNDKHVVWQSAQYPEPGVAAFITPEIVQLAFADAGYVDAFINKRARGISLNKEDLWNKMISSPNDSPEFKALIFNAILVAAANDLQDERTRNAVQIFENYIKQRRAYIGIEAINMYNAYGDLNAAKQNSAAGNVQMGAGPSGAMGIAPDDYLSVAYAAAAPDSRGENFMRALLDLSGTPYEKPTSTAQEGDGGKIATAAFYGYTLDTVDKIHTLLQNLRVIKGIEAIEGKGFQGALLFLTFASSALEIAEGAMTMTEQAEAEKKYNELAAEISEDVKLGEILKSGSDEEKNRLVLWWALATSSYGASDTVGQFPRKDADVCVAYPSQCADIKRIVAKANPVVHSTPVPLPPAPPEFVAEVKAVSDLAKMLSGITTTAVANAMNPSIPPAVQKVNQAMATAKQMAAPAVAAADQHKAELDTAAMNVRKEITRIKGVPGAYPVIQSALAPLNPVLLRNVAGSD